MEEIDPGRPPDPVSRKRARAKPSTGVRPFWSSTTAEFAAALWSPTETGSRAVDASAWSASSKRLAANSWFAVDMCAGTSPPSSAATDVAMCKEAREAQKREEKRLKLEAEEAAEAEAEVEAMVKKKMIKKTYANPVRARKVRIRPTGEQKAKIKQWLGATRFCYNALVAANRNVGQGGVTLASMTAVIRDLESKHAWLADIPYDIRYAPIRDMDKARKVHFAKLRKDPSMRATFKFRSKKDSHASFEVRARDMVRKRGAFASLAIGSIVSKATLPASLDASVRFVRDRLDRYFLIIPREVEKKSESQAPSSGVVALDPGVRTFQTTFDASGLATEWGKGGTTRLVAMCHRADVLQREVSQKSGSKRRGAERQRLRVFEKIRNTVKEIHRKLAVWLCENYRVILIPIFETSRMVATRVRRKISSKSVRSMLTWSHYAFRQLLKAKAELYPWVRVVECDEAYTSKTCGSCGEIHATLGGSKVFECKKCAYKADRDLNGARNILLRWLTL